jgi:excisionase family DNA binding protein
MQTVQLQLPTEFKTELNLIRAELEKLKLHFEPRRPKTYLSRAEVSTLLNVSLVTLNKWNKNGTLKAVGLGGRVLYRQEDIDSKIVEL